MFKSRLLFIIPVLLLGITFSQQSGDNNKIHTNFIAGYNSPFGENIIHGALVIIKFLNIVKLKNYECIKVCFSDGVQYDTKIVIKIKFT